MEGVEFKEDGGVKVWMRKTKTDVVGRGSRCKFMRKECGGVSVAKILKWYMVLLDWEPSSYVFCRLDKKGKAVGKEYLRYGEARARLMEEQRRLGIEGLFLHSGRIGGATAAARAGVGRAEIKVAEGWRSDAVDGYIRPEEEGMEVSSALVDGLQL